MRSHYAVNAIKSTRVSLQRDFLRASMLKVNLMTQHGFALPEREAGTTYQQITSLVRNRFPENTFFLSGKVF